jgi:hypothetical protein
MRKMTGVMSNIYSLKRENRRTSENARVNLKRARPGDLDPRISERKIHEMVISHECAVDEAILIQLHTDDLLEVRLQFRVRGLSRHPTGERLLTSFRGDRGIAIQEKDMIEIPISGLFPLSLFQLSAARIRPSESSPSVPV